jgi:hypothetical protein
LVRLFGLFLLCRWWLSFRLASVVFMLRLLLVASGSFLTQTSAFYKNMVRLWRSLEKKNIRASSIS